MEIHRKKLKKEKVSIYLSVLNYNKSNKNKCGVNKINNFAERKRPQRKETLQQGSGPASEPFRRGTETGGAEKSSVAG